MSAPLPLPAGPDTQPQLCAHCGSYSAATLASEDHLCPACDASARERRRWWFGRLESLEAELSAPPAPSPARQPSPPSPTRPAAGQGGPPPRLPRPRVITWLDLLIAGLVMTVVLVTGGLAITAAAVGLWTLIGSIPR